MKNIELRSEDIQEIIGQPPSWLVRRGIAVFFMILCFVIGISFMVSYPDIIKVPFRLSSTNIPKSVTAKATGKVIKLFVKEDQEVNINEVLGVLESTAGYDEVMALSSELESIRNIVQTERSDDLATRNLPAFTKLGELQSAYQVFTQTYTQYLSFLSNGFYLEKKRMLQNELSDLISLHKILALQNDLQKQDFQLAESEYNIQKQLSDQKVIAQLDFQKETSKFIMKKMNLFQIETALINNVTFRTAKRKEILELDKTISEQTDVFIQSINTMKSNIDIWKNQHLLTAPISGKVQFPTFIQENENVTAGQELFFIGTNYIQIFGEIKIPQENFGKVKQGQLVVVKFDSYPFQEFGVIEGRIEFISEIPGKDSTFFAKVVIPSGLTTTYNKKLNYRAGMNATAEIITQDHKLIERILYNFRKAGSR